jgi:hypothetical protein
MRKSKGNSEQQKQVSEYHFPLFQHQGKKKLNKQEVNLAMQCHPVPSGKFMPCS